MDRYRDPKDISKEYLLKKLKEINPLEPPKEAFQYPKALKLRYRNMPSWLKTKELRYQTGLGRVQDEQWDEYK